MKLPQKLLIKTNQRAKLEDVPSARLPKKLQKKLRSKRSQVTMILAVRAAALSARRPRKKQLRRLIAARRATIHPPTPAQTPKRIVVAVAKKMVTHLKQLRSQAISKSLI